MKRFLRQFRYGQKGFTLIELLVVVAILGVLAAVVVPNVGKFIGKGHEEAWSTELHNVQTGVMAMLADSTAGKLDGPVGPTTDMAIVLADGGTKNLSEYLTGLGDDLVTPLPETTCVTSGCTYTFSTDGAVTQTTPTP